MDIMHIAFCLDNNYVEQILAVIRSIARTNGDRNVNIYLVFNDLNEQNQARFKTVETDKLAIHCRPTNVVVDGVGPKNHVSKATFVKFELINALPELSKVLYLDGDIIVNGDLAPLWQTELNDYYLAAVENPFSTRQAALDMDPDAIYFNAGILLLNLAKMREDNFYQKAHDYIEQSGNKLMFHDQDVFNHLVNGQFVQLSEVFNFQTFFIRKIHRFSPDKRSYYRNIMNNATIVHYSSGIKPWDKFDPHPLVGLFRQYYQGKLKQAKDDSYLLQLLRYLYVKAYYFYFLNLAK
ncbi:MAG: glycosyltransferase family 8 protein [Pseudomonadota bacterium]|nr:glycosyltransferase family 8 protein [Pseudomonadota bacterium]